jgi:hypothetical protein
MVQKLLVGVTTCHQILASLEDINSYLAKSTFHVSRELLTFGHRLQKVKTARQQGPRHL